MPVRSKLRLGEWCVLHCSRRCCGRGEKPREVKELKFRRLRDGSRIYPDGREVYPDSKLKRIKDRMIQENPTCLACGDGFSVYEEIELAHKKPKGMGGFKRDDREHNLYLMHKTGNRRQGSVPLKDYLDLCKSKGIHPCQ